MLDKQNLIQSNLTEKFLRTFLRLQSQVEGIGVTSYPFLVDTYLHLELSDTLNCDNVLLRSAFESIKSNNKNKII